MSPPGKSTDEPEDNIDSVTMIAEALREKFNDGAILVAENQRNVASGDTRVTWGEIVARLKA